MSSKSVLLIDETAGKRLELPVLRGTEGEPTLDIKSLPSTLGYFTYDPGFGATASCTSKITFIDGGRRRGAKRATPSPGATPPGADQRLLPGTDRPHVNTRLVGDQFEDDLNTLLLERYVTVDLLASRVLKPGLEAFLAVENLFDQTYAVGRTPVETLGAPRLVHGGVRLAIGR